MNGSYCAQIAITVTLRKGFCKVSFKRPCLASLHGLVPGLLPWKVSLACSTFNTPFLCWIYGLESRER